jgi:lipid-A-disaccharide synthase
MSGSHYGFSGLGVLSLRGFKKMRIGIIAGEHSGDQLAADLIIALRKYQPDLQIEGIAGPQMLKAGCKAIIPMERIAYMGLLEVVKHIPSILKARQQIQQHFLDNPPDIFIGVDAPDFNLFVEEKLKQRGIKTVHYVSPSVWAWRQGRLKKIARAVNLMLTLLPFEAQFYVRNNIPVEFVGHYLADQIPLENDMQAARQALDLPVDAKIIALLPGSRTHEIQYLAEVFLQTAKKCKENNSELIFIVPMVNETRMQQFNAVLQQVAPGLPIKIFIGQSQKVMAAADAILLASGTATLEAMLFKKPMVVAYRMSVLTYAIAKRLIKTKFISLPNLLAGKALVPEFIQEDASIANLSQALLNYLNNSEQVLVLKNEFLELHKSLRLNASEHSAKAILRLVSHI